MLKGSCNRHFKRIKVYIQYCTENEIFVLMLQIPNVTVYFKDRKKGNDNRFVTVKMYKVFIYHKYICTNVRKYYSLSMLMQGELNL
ncbi:hypothetical protein GDO86_009024 [Hymenochirus boettgeri]|uniref:Uncharacterized protein n=1 Tax=Hymenochirus boettgeri TaxID=247094 RepID=A0A8T2JHA9_9PIPI|nr:hypothetical protein GDO86_009024 [Hymenochirus boettgeri]